MRPYYYRAFSNHTAGKVNTVSGFQEQDDSKRTRDANATVEPLSKSVLRATALCSRTARPATEAQATNILRCGGEWVSWGDVLPHHRPWRGSIRADRAGSPPPGKVMNCNGGTITSKCVFSQQPARPRVVHIPLTSGYLPARLVVPCSNCEHLNRH